MSSKINETSSEVLFKEMLEIQQKRPDDMLQFLRDHVENEYVDAAGRTLLHCAVLNADEENVIMIHDAGADENAQDADQMTPLMFAAMKRNLFIFEYLYDVGADPFIENNQDLDAMDYASGDDLREMEEIVRFPPRWPPQPPVDHFLRFS